MNLKVSINELSLKIIFLSHHFLPWFHAPAEFIPLHPTNSISFRTNQFPICNCPPLHEYYFHQQTRNISPPIALLFLRILSLWILLSTHPRTLLQQFPSCLSFTSCPLTESHFQKYHLFCYPHIFCRNSLPIPFFTSLFPLSLLDCCFHLDSLNRYFFSNSVLDLKIFSFTMWYAHW